MKKSEIYFKAQVAVVNSNCHVLDKLEILRQLMNDEDVAKYVEKNEETEENNDGKSV